ncbi:MAG TPA: hypothetical protein VM260_07680 [Pirellula sp.]|nr:hypothetical protein [Pirellula sp.]
MSCKLELFVLGVCFFIADGAELRAQQTPIATNVPKHVHPTHGPHGGELLEIGKEEFHAELVVNESKKQMVIYLLEKDSKSSIAIEAPFLAINFMLAGKPVQVQLKSIPQDFDQNGLSSCFGAVSPELIDALHAAKSDPKLAVRIRNKAYVTKIIHKHDHSGHNHAQQPLVVPSKRR